MGQVHVRVTLTNYREASSLIWDNCLLTRCITTKQRRWLIRVLCSVSFPKRLLID